MSIFIVVVEKSAVCAFIFVLIFILDVRKNNNFALHVFKKTRRFDVYGINCWLNTQARAYT